MKYQAQYDKQARAWNVIDTTTDDIVGMFGRGQSGEQRARRSADNHNQAWLEGGLAEHDALKRLAGELAVVDGDENASIYGYAADETTARAIAEHCFADEIARVECYGPITLDDGEVLPKAWVAITADNPAA